MVLSDLYLANAVRSSTASVLNQLTSAANDVEKLIERRPQDAEQLRRVSVQLWAMTDVARDLERDAAGIAAEVRANA